MSDNQGGAPLAEEPIDYQMVVKGFVLTLLDEGMTLEELVAALRTASLSVTGTDIATLFEEHNQIVARLQSKLAVVSAEFEATKSVTEELQALSSKRDKRLEQLEAELEVLREIASRALGDSVAGSLAVGKEGKE